MRVFKLTITDQGSSHCKRSVDFATWYGAVFQFVVSTLVVSSPDSCTLLGVRGLLFWSCLSVLQLATLPNTWTMTTDVCRYGVLRGWIDS